VPRSSRNSSFAWARAPSLSESAKLRHSPYDMKFKENETKEEKRILGKEEQKVDLRVDDALLGDASAGGAGDVSIR